ncbi:MAG: organic hydroperoxide resistance protein [Rickettsiales bacterium]
MQTLMTAHAKSVGGRAGHVESDDGIIALDLAAVGSGKQGSNPEQLFAAGYSACFGSALDHVAKSKKLDTGEITVAADVSLNQDESGFSIGVTLNVGLPNLSGDQANELVKAAHHVCPYSKATRGNVDVQFTVNSAPLKQAA